MSAVAGAVLEARSLVLEAVDTAPHAARQFTRETCDEWGIELELRDDIALVVSELVTNAVKHAIANLKSLAGASLTTSLTPCSDGKLVAEVFDPDLTEAVPRSVEADLDDEGLRGLKLVAALALDWGWRKLPDGKGVWAEFSLNSPLLPPP